MPCITVKQISYGSDDYRNAWDLREQVLRLPLGLTFTEEDIQIENQLIHIAAFTNSTVIGAVVLVRETNETLKMRQVTVHADWRGHGIGARIVKFCIEYGKEHGFCHIYCHSRDTVIPFYERYGFEKVGDVFVEQTIPHQKMIKQLN